MGILKVALVALGLLAGGCAPRLAELPSIPAGAAAVEAQAEKFKTPQGHPLFDLPSGAVRDDLSRLAGCWGGYAGPELLHGEGFIRANAEFYRFDFQAMTMAHQILQRGDAPFGFDVAGEWVYAFEVADKNRISVRLVCTRAWSTYADLPVVEMCPVTDAEAYELLVTVEGDAFKFGESAAAPPDFSGEHRSGLIFFRMECPPQ